MSRQSVGLPNQFTPKDIFLWFSCVFPNHMKSIFLIDWTPGSSGNEIPVIVWLCSMSPKKCMITIEYFDEISFDFLKTMFFNDQLMIEIH